MKSYTDLEQSKKLAEILPLESADMNYCNMCLKGVMYADSFKAGLSSYEDATKMNQENIDFYLNRTDYKGIIAWEVLPCWSLASLLDTLPFLLIVNNQRYAFSMHKGLNKDGETYVIRYNVFNTDITLCETDYFNNIVDACYEMIIKLHELKML